MAGAGLSAAETAATDAKGSAKSRAAGTAINRLFCGGRVLSDGAMGTMLYGRGIFINRCYDELNLSQPETVAGVHAEYLQAGAQIIETNTFGANAFRLERYGLRDKVREINLAGVRIARQSVAQIAQKQATEAYVAGAIGPLGVALAPQGELSLEQARAAFAEQIAALAEGGPGVGADLLILETMTSLAEAGEAIRAAREVAPGLRLVVMMTVDEDGNCLDGATPEIAAERLTKWGADAIGCNCSDGPATVLTVIERMRRAAPRRRWPQHLHGLAGVHGQLRAQVHPRGGEPHRRLLRNHAQPHPRHAVCDARPTGAGGVGTARRGWTGCGGSG
jgi:homocysteine S-methyltransferase